MPDRSREPRLRPGATSTASLNLLQLRAENEEIPWRALVLGLSEDLNELRSYEAPTGTDPDSVDRLLEMSQQLYEVTKVYEDARPAALRQAWDELRERENRVTKDKAIIDEQIASLKETRATLDRFKATMKNTQRQYTEMKESVDRLNNEVEQYKASAREKALTVSSLQELQQQAVSELGIRATRIASLEKAFQDARVDLEATQSNSDQLRRDNEANTNELKKLEAEFQSSEKSSRVKVQNLEILVKDRSHMVTELDNTLKDKIEEHEGTLQTLETLKTSKEISDQALQNEKDEHMRTLQTLSGLQQSNVKINEDLFEWYKNQKKDNEDLRCRFTEVDKVLTAQNAEVKRFKSVAENAEENAKDFKEKLGIATKSFLELKDMFMLTVKVRDDYIQLFRDVSKVALHNRKCYDELFEKFETNAKFINSWLAERPEILEELCQRKRLFDNSSDNSSS